MGFFKRLFHKEEPQEIPPMPPWEEIVETMYDKGLDAFADQVVRVIYSVDKTMRYVVLKNEKGFFTYQLETIYQFDKDVWQYIFSQKNVLPAMWEVVRGSGLFAYETDLMNDMRSASEYKQYFE